jgi:tetrahydromethanopterin S-methyltransferase subunit G
LAFEASALTLTKAQRHPEDMVEETPNIVLEYLRRIDAKVDRLVGDVQDLKHRVTSVEGQAAGVRADLANMAAPVDRIESRLDRIERRLELSQDVMPI